MRQFFCLLVGAYYFWREIWLNNSSFGASGEGDYYFCLRFSYKNSIENELFA